MKHLGGPLLCVFQPPRITSLISGPSLYGIGMRSTKARGSESNKLGWCYVHPPVIFVYPCLKSLSKLAIVHEPANGHAGLPETSEIT